jgi:hypothetical protein
MTVNKKITWQEYQKIKDIKTLDLEICDYQHVNILNLGWEPWGKWFCSKHEKEHVLCKELCLPVVRKMIDCELVRKRIKRIEESVKPNKSYDLANCYDCGKELKGAGKTGKIKNRNNPSFWGIGSSYKIMCLGCIGKRFYNRMVDWQKKKWREYKRRGYV